jgi:hypothetical protein
MDESMDYQTQYYVDNSKYFDKDNPGINTTNVQFPRQSSSTDCFGGGTHWRLEKSTPLFQGEDFFIDFKRYAKENSVSTLEGTEVAAFYPGTPLSMIDVYGDLTESPNAFALQVPGLTEPQNIFLNRAVREAEDPGDRKAFRLFDQAYYVIEMGDPSQSRDGSREHYFIMITERAYPIFVMIDEVEGFTYSRILSAFDEEQGGTHGAAILNASRARMTVRNHF